MSRVRIEGVQGLRGLAALAVVWVHIISDLLPSGGGDLHDVGFYGNCGVDIFFVISGFIMVVSSAEGGFLPGKFMLKRIARVAPPYWLYTLLFFSAALVFPSLFSRFKPDWVQLVQTLLFIPGRDPPVIVVGWTLNLEMFFYACFAVAKSQTRHFVPLLGAIFLALVLAGWYCKFEDPILATYTNPLLLEFVAGCVIGMLFLKQNVSPLIARLLGLLGLVLWATLPIFVSWESNRLIAFGPAAIIVVMGAAFGFPKLHARLALVLVFLGDISYSLYLTHTLVFRVIRHLLERGILGPDATLIFAISLAAAVGFAWFCFILVERPVTSKLNGFIFRLYGSRGATAPAVAGTP